LKILGARRPDFVRLVFSNDPGLLAVAGVEPLKPASAADVAERDAALAEALRQPGVAGTAIAARSEAELRFRKAMLAHLEGRSAAEVLALVSSLSLAAVPPDGFVEAFESASPRQVAYGLLWTELKDRSAPADRALRSAVFEAWERDLVTAKDDPSLIRMLVATENLERAVAVSRTADSAGAEGAIRATFDAAVARAEALHAAMAAAQAKALAEATAGMSARERRQFERAVKDLGIQTAEPTPTFTDEDFRLAAAAELETARLDLFSATQKAGRSDLARDAAEQLLSDEPSEALVSRSAALVGAASPETAVTWLEALEGRLRKFDPERERDTPPRTYPGVRTRGEVKAANQGASASLDLQATFSAAARGWLALGRRDRVDALIDRWRPQAAAEAAAARRARAKGDVVQTPYAWQLAHILLLTGREDEARGIGVLRPDDFLRHDLTSGKGVADLPRYLAEAGDDEARGSLLITCHHAALEQRAFADARTCWEAKRRYDDTPMRKMMTVEFAIRIAGAAGHAREDATAVDMLERGLVAARDVPWDDPDLSIGSDTNAFDVLDAVKAHLRRDGRLTAER
jgi:hypothetical protein